MNMYYFIFLRGACHAIHMHLSAVFLARRICHERYFTGFAGSVFAGVSAKMRVPVLQVRFSSRSFARRRLFSIRSS